MSQESHASRSHRSSRSFSLSPRRHESSSSSTSAIHTPSRRSTSSEKSMNDRRRSHMPTSSDRAPKAVRNQDLLPTSLPAADLVHPKIILNPQEKVLYETLAKGTAASKNSDWLDKVARVDSIANRAPYLQRDFRKGEGSLKLREQPLIEQHDLLYRALGVATLIGNEDHDQNQVKNCVGSIISMALHNITVWRRWMALDNLNIPRSAIPGCSSMLLDLKEHDNPHKEDDKIHYLFGQAAEQAIEKELKDKKKKKEQDDSRYRSVYIPHEPNPGLDVQPLESELDMILEPQLKFHAIEAPTTAGRLSDFDKNWQLLSSEPFILQAIKGYRIPFKGRRPKSRRNYATKCDPRSTEASQEVQKLLDKKAIYKIPAKMAKWISPMFFVPKKDGSLRPIINLKKLNRNLRIPHFKMEGLLNVKDLLTPGAFMAKLDLKDAYFGIPIDKKDQKYLTFRALGNIYAFKALPFGLATAPYTYTRITKTVATYLRSLGIKLIVYLDDWLLIADTTVELETHLEIVQETLNALGFIVNVEKSELKPVQQIEFLGLKIDSISMLFSVPDTKISKVRQLAKAIKGMDTCPARTIAKFCGLLASFKLASELSRLQTRALQRLLKGINRSRIGFKKIIQISKEAKEEAAFWSIAPKKVFQNRIATPPITHCIRTDASKQGWGMYSNHLQTGGRWSEEETKWHINALELKAIQLSLLTAFKTASDIGIRIETDNTTALAFVNRRGGTRGQKLHMIATEIWKWALSRNIHLIATHIAGVKNIEADRESRNFKECCEWQLETNVATMLFNKLGWPEVDLFASRINAKCKNYYSLNPDPEALGIDAFAYSWKGLLAYAFPPFNLIGRTVRKAMADAADLILVTPEWRSAPFWPMWRGSPITLFRSPSIECMEDLLQVWIKLGINENAAKTILASWAPGTQKSYNGALKKWREFSKKQKLNPLEPSPSDIINFFQETLDSGKGHSSVATQRAALSALLSSTGRIHILQEAESLMARFHKGMLKEKPAAPKHAEIWDVEIVLDWIRNQWPLEELSLKELTLKTVLLLALCSPKRAGELATLSLTELRRSDTKWEFRLLRTKNRGSGKPHAATYELFEEDPRLCPLETMKAYLHQTQELRETEDRLLISFKKPHKPVTAATVARWLKYGLEQAGIVGYTGHSTRSAATSKAAQKGLSSNQIMAAANWSEKGSTFQRFYNKEIQGSFQAVVLNQGSSNPTKYRRDYHPYDSKKRREETSKRRYDDKKPGGPNSTKRRRTGK